jgi:anti-sigma factor RsiW
MRGDDTRREPAADLPDRALWQRGRVADAPEDDAGRALDLAGFADAYLDPDDRERVAEWLAGDPLAAGDVAAARSLAARAEQLDAAPEPVIARACALVGSAPQRGTVVAFRISRRDRSGLRGMAGWGSLVAAMALASWLGFTLGMDTSLSFGQAAAQSGQTGEDGFLGEMLDPGAGFMRELTEGNQT